MKSSNRGFCSQDSSIQSAISCDVWILSDVYKMRRGQTGDSCPVSHRDLSQHNKKKLLRLVSCLLNLQRYLWGEVGWDWLIFQLLKLCQFGEDSPTLSTSKAWHSMRPPKNHQETIVVAHPSTSCSSRMHWWQNYNLKFIKYNLED